MHGTFMYNKHAHNDSQPTCLNPNYCGDSQLIFHALRSHDEFNKQRGANNHLVCLLLNSNHNYILATAKLTCVPNRDSFKHHTYSFEEKGDHIVHHSDL